jgi:hypothetical protein
MHLILNGAKFKTKFIKEIVSVRSNLTKVKEEEGLKR